MGRRVGSFINPKTKEEDWIDMSTIKIVKLSSETVRQMGEGRENNRSLINFSIDSIDMLNVVTITAEYSHEGKTYKAKPVHIKEMDFAEAIAESVYEEKIIDDLPLIVSAKEEAMENVAGEMLKKGIITGNLALTGSGYIIHEKTRAMTIDKVVIDITESNKAMVELEMCTGPVGLSAIPDPSLVFYTPERTFVIDNFEINEGHEGRIQRYVIEADRIKVDPPQAEEAFKPFKEFDTEDDEEVEAFIIDRKKHLDDMTSEDSDALEDRFADIF